MTSPNPPNPPNKTIPETSIIDPKEGQTMTRYKSGYRLERRVRAIYSENGWLATRFPKSGGKLNPADVLAVKRRKRDTQIHLVECKNLSKKKTSGKRIYLDTSQVDRLREEARQHKAEAFIAYSFPYQRPMILPSEKLRSTGRMFYLERKDGKPLQPFLSEMT